EPLVHDVTLLPRHAPSPEGAKVSPMCPEYAVTYVQGRTPVPTRNSIRASELMPCRSEYTVLRSTGQPPRCSSWRWARADPDRRARIVTIETSADRFLHQLTGQ